MTDSHSPFLATICDHAESDGPRLVWADYLEDNGDSDRAEFIRGGIELACRCKSLSPPDGTGIRRSELCIACSQGGHNYTQEEIDRGACDPRCGCQWCKLRCRQIDLFRKHGQAWFGDAVGGKVGVPCERCRHFPLGCPDCYDGSLKTGRVVQWPLTVQVPCERCNDRGESQNPNFRCLLCSGYATILTVARGFLDVLRAPTMEVFLGIDCPGCNGHGFIGRGGHRIGRINCDRCKGEKRLPGLARLLAVAPIMAVSIADRKPEQVDADDGPYWHWLSSGDSWREASEYIPGCIYAWLPRKKRNRFEYVTADLANLALSQACVKWGRKVNEKPPTQPIG